LPGKTGRNTIITSHGEKTLNSKANIGAKKGWIIQIQTPGGGGYGALPNKKST